MKNLRIVEVLLGDLQLDEVDPESLHEVCLLTAFKVNNVSAIAGK